jgi:hypothetical protein
MSIARAVADRLNPLSAASLRIPGQARILPPMREPIAAYTILAAGVMSVRRASQSGSFDHLLPSPAILRSGGGGGAEQLGDLGRSSQQRAWEHPHTYSDFGSSPQRHYRFFLTFTGFS